jgi:hypothetical protein
VSAETLAEGEQVPAGFDAPTRTEHDPLDRSMDSGG